MQKTENDWFNQLVEKEAEEALAEEFVRHPEQSLMKEVLLERKKTQAKERLQLEVDDFNSDLSKANDLLGEWLNSMLPEQRESFQNEFQKGLDRLNATEPDNSVPLQSLMGISDKWMEKIYSLSYSLQMEKENYQDSKALLRLLVYLNPNVSDFWLALGYAQYKLNMFTQADNSFTNAATVDPTNPRSYYFLALNAIEKQNPADATTYTNVGLKVIKGEADEEHWTQVFEAILKSINEGESV